MYMFVFFSFCLLFWFSTILENCSKYKSFLFYWWVRVSTVLKWQVLVFVISLFTSICSCFCEPLSFLGWGFPLSCIPFTYCNSSMLLSCDAVFSLVLHASMHSCKSYISFLARVSDVYYCHEHLRQLSLESSHLQVPDTCKLLSNVPNTATYALTFLVCSLFR